MKVGLASTPLFHSLQHLSFFSLLGQNCVAIEDFTFLGGLNHTGCHLCKAALYVYLTWVVFIILNRYRSCVVRAQHYFHPSDHLPSILQISCLAPNVYHRRFPCSFSPQQDNSSLITLWNACDSGLRVLCVTPRATLLGWERLAIAA